MGGSTGGTGGDTGGKTVAPILLILLIIIAPESCDFINHYIQTLAKKLNNINIFFENLFSTPSNGASRLHIICDSSH